MKKLIFFAACIAAVNLSSAQDKQQIERACLDYIEGFYEGDTAKLIAALKPSMYKIGYWKNKNSGAYDFDGQMTYRQALDYARNLKEKKNFPKADAPKKVEVLDIGHTIASAKVYAWWGIDYILLAKQNGKWMIEQVLWEGPPETK